VDFDQYVVARHGRLVEHAVSLGCLEDQARRCVAEVLQAQRRAIQKAEDPDPLVREALERAVSGTPPPRGRPGPLAVLGVLALVVAGIGTASHRPPAATPMPSLFGLDRSAAQRLLEGRGYEVVVVPTPACAPEGLVVASYPRPGQPVRQGATVTVRTAGPRQLASCAADGSVRADAWAFVGFALGGRPPAFADTVHVIVDRSEPAMLNHDEALDGTRWGGTFDLIATAGHQIAGTDTGLPVLRADEAVPPDSWCGVPRPIEAGERSALRIEIDPRGPRDDHGCPLTIDLYRVGRVVDSVVVYTPKALATQ
jgi:hypothetical protein